MSLIIIVKLAIMFLILKIFFFPDILKTKFKTYEERHNHLIHELTGTRR